MKKEESEIFAALRFESASFKAYQFKKERVKTAYELMEAFKANNGEIDNEIREKAQLYYNAIYEINYYEKIDPATVSDDRVLNCVNGIIQNSNKTLIKYYLSFKRKKSDEYAENAWKDLLFAYKAYCLSNGISINENITLEEMELFVSDVQSNTDKAKNSEQLK